MLLTTAALAQSPEPLAQASSIKAHMAFLGDDLLEGREAGSVGYGIAANYVAAQFAQFDLTPAGDRGAYFQPVPLAAVRARDQGRFVAIGNDGEVTLTSGTEVITAAPFGRDDLKISAPLVFVGYGTEALGRDDYRGLDVKGKIVVFLRGAPTRLDADERAYHSNLRTKRALAARHGAVGLISVTTPALQKNRPFSAAVSGWDAWSMSWITPHGEINDALLGPPLLANVSVAGAEKLFAGSKRRFADVAAAADGGKEPPRFALATSLRATVRTESKTVRSVNVAGLLEGSDPMLKSEVVVLSAHLDHIGLSPSGEDRVNNGALDNASGVASLLEVARLFTQSQKSPRRSVLFVALTAQEKGLVGSEYFARNPTVPADSIIADVNLDMPILLYDFTDVIAIGAERSTMSEALHRAGEQLNIALSPDPLAEQGMFTRSDHYRFVEVGVPSVSLMTGFQNGGEAQYRAFTANCRHRPCDDLSQAIDYAAGAKFAQLGYGMIRELAEADRRPLWKKGDFFALRFANTKSLTR